MDQFPNCNELVFFCCRGGDLERMEFDNLTNKNNLAIEGKLASKIIG